MPIAYLIQRVLNAHTMLNALCILDLVRRVLISSGVYNISGGVYNISGGVYNLR